MKDKFIIYFTYLYRLINKTKTKTKMITKLYLKKLLSVDKTTSRLY
jgi:hypothetical protein